MGLARKTRRKYDTPNHPWQAERIDEEKKLIEEYGLTNKKQIWKMSSLLRNFRKQARDIIGLRSERKEASIKILISKLTRLGLLNKDSTTGDVLNLSLRDILERRLQTVVYKMGLANSVKQARQFILHRKVVVNEKVISSPSYLINTGDKVSLKSGFTPNLVKIVVEAPKEEVKESEASSSEEVTA
jgi:small subunit ribosomal protein S4